MADDDQKVIQNLWDKLLSSVESAVDLRVVTYVGEIETNGSLNEPIIAFPDKAQAKVMATSINLAQGDITSAVPEEFWAPEKQVIRDFHQAQVAQANMIVERNVRLVLDLAKQLASELKGIAADEASRSSKNSS